MKFAVFFGSETLRIFFRSYQFFCEKKTFLNVSWARLSNNTIRYAFYENFSGIIDFQENRGFFPKINHLFPQKNPTFEHLWDFSNTKTLWNAFFKRVARYCDCEKYQVFSGENPCIFLKSPTFEIFQISGAIIPSEAHSREISPKLAIFKKIVRLFFDNTHLHFQKSQSFEHFEISWAVLLQDPKARKKRPRLPILR